MKIASRDVAVFVHNRDFFGTRLIHLPLLDALREYAAGGRLTVLAPFESARCYAEWGVADEVVVYGRGLASPALALRRRAPGVVVNLRPTSFPINAATRLSGAPVRLSYANPTTRALMSATVPRDTTIWRGDNYHALLAPLGVGALDTVRVVERLATPLDEPAPELLLMPGSGGGEFKRWGVERYLALARALREAGDVRGVGWVLGPDEADVRARLAAESDELRGQVHVSPAIGRLAALARAARLVVANDCGPAHMAHLALVPRVVLFSDHDGTAPARIAEWFRPGPRARVLASPRGEAIGVLEVQEVARAAREALEGARADERTRQPVS